MGGVRSGGGTGEGRLESRSNYLADKSAVRHELPVDPVQNRLREQASGPTISYSIEARPTHLEIIPLARILRVKELKKSCNQSCINVFSRYFGFRASRYHKAKEKLVNNMQMWPSPLQDRLVLLRVKRSVSRPCWQWTENVCRNLPKHAQKSEFCLKSNSKVQTEPC